MTKKTFENAGKTVEAKKTAKTAKTARAKLDVLNMKGEVVARVARFAGKLGTIAKGSTARVTEQRYVDARVTEIDAKHGWADGMKLAYYVECLTYWNEVAAQLDGWGLDVRRIDCDTWNGAWRAWGRGVTQAKLVKKLFAAGYGKDGQTQKDARGKTDARTREQRTADVDAILKG